MDRLKTYFKLSLPLLFIIYVGFLIAFTHIHIVNGVTIVHSHPYEKSDGIPIQHDHSHAELQLLHQISTIELAGALVVLFLLTALFTQLPVKHFIPDISIYRRPEIGHTNLRGPPFYM